MTLLVVSQSPSHRAEQLFPCMNVFTELIDCVTAYGLLLAQQVRTDVETGLMGPFKISNQNNKIQNSNDRGHHT